MSAIVTYDADTDTLVVERGADHREPFGPHRFATVAHTLGRITLTYASEVTLAGWCAVTHAHPMPVDVVDAVIAWIGARDFATGRADASRAREAG